MPPVTSQNDATAMTPAPAAKTDEATPEAILPNTNNGEAAPASTTPEPSGKSSGPTIIDTYVQPMIILKHAEPAVNGDAVPGNGDAIEDGTGNATTVPADPAPTLSLPVPLESPQKADQNAPTEAELTDTSPATVDATPPATTPMDATHATPPSPAVAPPQTVPSETASQESSTVSDTPEERPAAESALPKQSAQEPTPVSPVDALPAENTSPGTEPIAAPQTPEPMAPDTAPEKQPTTPPPAATSPKKDHTAVKQAQRRQYGPTRSGQTLAQITKEVRNDKQVDFYQLLYAIFLTNPEAFDNNNINGLKKGAMLTIPNSRDISHVDAAVAKEKIAQHTAQWRSAHAPATAPAKPKTKAELETALKEVDKFAAENKELADRLATTEQRIKALLEQNRIRDEQLRKIAEKIQEPVQ